MARATLYILFRGEIFHQLALRAERRSEVSEARRRYDQSLRSFEKKEHLGRARVLRDYGLFLCKNDEHQQGLTYIETALALHDQDVQNDKSERQRRITLGYLWRAQIIVQHEEAGRALERLAAFALEGCLDCSPRDQYFVVSFAREHAPLPLRPALDTRLLDIHAERGKPIRTVQSIATWVIDTELLIAQQVVRRVFRTISRKE